MISEWDQNSADQIALTPLGTVETALIERRIVGVRFELSPSSAHADQPHIGLVAIQVGMTPEQTRDLIRLLQWNLDQLDDPPSGSDLMALSRYTFLLASNLQGAPAPWPRRPALLSLPPRKKKSTSKGRRLPRKGRPPPPGS